MTSSSRLTEPWAISESFVEASGAVVDLVDHNRRKGADYWLCRKKSESDRTETMHVWKYVCMYVRREKVHRCGAEEVYVGREEIYH